MKNPRSKPLKSSGTESRQGCGDVETVIQILFGDQKVGETLSLFGVLMKQNE